MTKARRFGGLFVGILQVGLFDLFDHHQIAGAGAFGVGQRRLIFGRVITIDRCLQAGKTGDDIAGAVVPLKLDIFSAARQKHAAMGGDGRTRTCGIFAIGVGIGDMDMGNPQRGGHHAPNAA